MKLILTLVAFATFAMPAFAQEWDMTPVAAPVTQSVQASMQYASSAPNSNNSGGVQWDLSSLQSDETTADAGLDQAAAIVAPLYSAPTGTQQVSGLQQSCLHPLAAVQDPTSPNGLPQCSLASCIQDQ